MSLATDILKRAEEIANPPSKARRAPRPSEPREAPKPKQSEPRKFGRTRAPAKIRRTRKGEHVPGVSFDGRSGGWAAYFYDGTKKILIGLFSSKARAVVARRIYMLWHKRGYYDIPNKPARRLYTNW
jgi:hypothetical protein